MAIIARGCKLEYLPLYSPNFNLIELSFAVLKAWIARHWRRLFPTHDGDFGSFLRFAIRSHAIIDLLRITSSLVVLATSFRSTLKH